MKPNQPDFSIIVDNISKKYEETVAVDNVSFKAAKGDIIALLGPNGAGKTTLMNMISGFLSPSSGAIFVNNESVASNDKFTKKCIGFLPEGAPMYSDMNVSSFLKYIIELKLNLSHSDTLSRQEIKSIYLTEFNRIIDLAKISDVLNKRIETLSKGYLRRVGFAQSIIGNPPILLLDEPTDGLDPNQKEHMRTLIKQMKKDKTVLISTHLLDEAETIANRIILIDKGKIIIDGTVSSILKFAKKDSLFEAFKTLTQHEED